MKYMYNISLNCLVKGENQKGLERPAKEEKLVGSDVTNGRLIGI